MSAFARFCKYGNGYQLYISAGTGNLTKDYKYVTIKANKQYVIVYPQKSWVFGAKEVRAKTKTCAARTIHCDTLFTERLVPIDIIGKRLKLKKMKTDNGYALVVCLHEEVA